MTWWTLLAGAPTAQAIPPGTAGLIVVDATLGPVTALLPAALGAAPLYVSRRDAGMNLATLAPLGQDTLVPASASAPLLDLWPGDLVALVPTGGDTWQVVQSALGVVLREATVAVLLAAGTTAGAAIESERIDAVAEGDMPRVLVFADADAEGVGGGGTAPAFDVTLNLVVQCLVEAARHPDAVAALDLLMMQVQDALLSDPTWLSLGAAVKNVKTTRSLKPEGDRVVGDGRLQIALTWTEIYRPRVTQPLSLITVATTPPAGTNPAGFTQTLPPA